MGKREAFQMEWRVWRNRHGAPRTDGSEYRRTSSVCVAGGCGVPEDGARKVEGSEGAFRPS